MTPDGVDFSFLFFAIEGLLKWVEIMAMIGCVLCTPVCVVINIREVFEGVCLCCQCLCMVVHFEETQPHWAASEIVHHARLKTLVSTLLLNLFARDLKRFEPSTF